MEVFGLPLHPLVVHAVVVLVPLSALGGLAISALTSMRVRYGWLVVLGAFGAAVSTYVAQLAGTSLAATFPQLSPVVARHIDLGDGLLVWVILLFVGALVQMLGQRMVDRGSVPGKVPGKVQGETQGKIARLGGIVVTVVTAVVATVQVVRIGHSGSYAVWG